MITDFQESGNQSLGIICKTFEQADSLTTYLKSASLVIPLTHLTEDSTAFKHGVIITTVHLSKGLEFDEVIIPFVSDRNYKTSVDKSMLYIACTRAMHKLTLTYSKELSIFLKN